MHGARRVDKDTRTTFMDFNCQLPSANSITKFIHSALDSYEAFLQKKAFNCYLTVPRPTLGHYRGGNLTHSMFNHCVCTFSTRRSPRALQQGRVPTPGGAQSGVEPGTFRFLLQRLKPLGHSPRVSMQLYNRKAYSEPFQTSRMEFFTKIVHGYQSLTIFAKNSILDI